MTSGITGSAIAEKLQMLWIRKKISKLFLHELIFVDSQKYYTVFFILLIKINGNDIVSCVYIAFLSFINHSFASASDG